MISISNMKFWPISYQIWIVLSLRNEHCAHSERSIVFVSLQLVLILHRIAKWKCFLFGVNLIDKWKSICCVCEWPWKLKLVCIGHKLNVNIEMAIKIRFQVKKKYGKLSHFRLFATFSRWKTKACKRMNRQYLQELT